jgi:Flp pilus assembly protein CpaB
MDMDSGRRRRFFLMLLGVVLALAAAGGVYVLGQQGVGDPGEEVEMADVLVATREIPARSTLTVDDLEVRSVPADAVLEQAYRDNERAVGRVTAVIIYPGQQITPNLFATAAADAPFDIISEDEEVTVDSPYWRAASVNIPRPRAVGGQVAAGQRVDLIITVEFAQPFVPVTNPETGEVTYQQVPAIPATNEEGELTGIISGRSTKISIPDLLVLYADPTDGTYIFKVTLEQAEQIAHVNQVAPDAFSIVLRPEQDNRSFEPGDYGQTTESMIMQYIYPVPLLVDLEELLGFPIGPVTGPITPTPTPDPNAEPTPEPEPEPEPEPSPEP